MRVVSLPMTVRLVLQDPTVLAQAQPLPLAPAKVATTVLQAVLLKHRMKLTKATMLQLALLFKSRVPLALMRAARARPPALPAKRENTVLTPK